MNITNIYEGISKYSIYLLAFLLPIFFFPGFLNVVEFPKQMLLIFLTLIAIIFYFLKMFSREEFKINVSPFHWLIIVFIIFSVASFFHSNAPFESFWGTANLSAGLVSLLAFALFYFLAVNLDEPKKEIRKILSLLVFSFCLAIVFNILQFYNIFLLPFSFAKSIIFSLAGNSNILALVAAVLLAMIFILSCQSRYFSKFLFSLIGILLFFYLLIVNFWVAWLLLLIEMIFTLVFFLARKDIFQASRVNFALIIFGTALFFMLVRTISFPFFPAAPPEIFPSYGATAQVAFHSLTEKVDNLFLGTGPATFFSEYLKYKPEVINQTEWWNVSFSFGESDLLEKIGTLGILGFVSFLIFILGVLILSLKKLIKSAEIDLLFLAIFIGWIGLVFSLIFYHSNLVLLFLFFAFSGFLASFSLDKRKIFDLKNSILVRFIAAFSLAISVILSLVLMTETAKRTIAEVYYQKAIESSQKGENEKPIAYLNKAIGFSSGKNDLYFRELANFYFSRFQKEVQGITDFKTLNEEQKKSLIFLSGGAINNSKSAVDINPNNVNNLLIRGFITRNLINFVGGTDKEAIKAYEEAKKLNPSNPVIYTELAQSYYLTGDTNKARENLEKAISLKSDYAPAHYQLAMIFIKEGKTKEAIERLENTQKIVFNDVGLMYQLGVLYYTDNQIDKAQMQFENAVKQQQNYSNARYFLGLIYDKKGKNKEAIEQFEKILELNSDNEEVKKILENLKAGKTALEGIESNKTPR